MKTSRKGFLCSVAALFLPAQWLPRPAPRFRSRKLVLTFADEVESAFERDKEVGFRVAERPIQEHPDYEKFKDSYEAHGVTRYLATECYDIKTGKARS